MEKQEKPVPAAGTLTVTTLIHAADYHDRMEMRYSCRYAQENGVHRLKYDDAENGFTVVKIQPDGEITIRRAGAAPIVLRQDYAHRVDYTTPYGVIPMVFTLQSASVNLSEDGGCVRYVSRVEIDGEPQLNTVTMELHL